MRLSKGKGEVQDTTNLGEYLSRLLEEKIEVFSLASLSHFT